MESALRALAEITTPRELLDGLAAFLRERGSAGAGNPLFEELARAVTSACVSDTAQQQLHEVRSLLQAVGSNLVVTRGLLDELLQSLPPGTDVDVQLIADFRAGLEDAWVGTNRAMAVSANSLSAYPRRTDDHAVLDAAIALAIRLLTAGCPGRPRIHVGPIPGVTVRASTGELLQVLINLLRNALDAIADAPDGKVEVTAWASSSAAFVRIEDNGPGIPTSSHEEVFRLFHTTKSGGSGVGLFVCRRLVEQWGGHLEVGSVAGSGAAFTFGIPRVL